MVLSADSRLLCLISWGWSARWLLNSVAINPFKDRFEHHKLGKKLIACGWHSALICHLKIFAFDRASWLLRFIPRLCRYSLTHLGPFGCHIAERVSLTFQQSWHLDSPLLSLYLGTSHIVLSCISESRGKWQSWGIHTRSCQTSFGEIPPDKGIIRPSVVMIIQLSCYIHVFSTKILDRFSMGHLSGNQGFKLSSSHVILGWDDTLHAVPAWVMFVLRFCPMLPRSTLERLNSVFPVSIATRTGITCLTIDQSYCLHYSLCFPGDWPSTARWEGWVVCQQMCKAIKDPSCFASGWMFSQSSHAWWRYMKICRGVFVPKGQAAGLAG